MRGHNRYLIYDMKNRYVTVTLPKRYGDKTVTGVVSSVYRDVLDKRIEIGIGSKKVNLKEPSIIADIDGDVVFVYGEHKRRMPVDDESVFDEMKRTGASGGTVDDALASLDANDVTVIRFKVADHRVYSVVRKKQDFRRKR